MPTSIKSWYNYNIKYRLAFRVRSTYWLHRDHVLDVLVPTLLATIYLVVVVLSAMLSGVD